MIVSRDQLLAVKLAGNDKKIPALSTLHITHDGDVISCNGRTVMLIEAVPEERCESIPFANKGKQDD